MNFHFQLQAQLIVSINPLKIQLHIMYFDTLLNSKATLLSNTKSAFVETAMIYISKRAGHDLPRHEHQYSGNEKL